MSYFTLFMGKCVDHLSVFPAFPWFWRYTRNMIIPCMSNGSFSWQLIRINDRLNAATQSREAEPGFATKQRGHFFLRTLALFCSNGWVSSRTDDAFVIRTEPWSMCMICDAWRNWHNFHRTIGRHCDGHIHSKKNKTKKKHS